MLLIVFYLSIKLELLTELKYRLELFYIEWFMIGSLKTKFFWAFIDPIQVWMWNNDLTNEEPFSIWLAEREKIRRIHEARRRPEKMPVAPDLSNKSLEETMAYLDELFADAYDENGNLTEKADK